MKFSTKTRYGIRVMVEIAKNDQLKGVYQKDISTNQKISLKYLDPIISSLKTAGLIANVKGKKSGYRLTRKAEDINIFQIHKAFEHEIAVIECLSEFAECDLKQGCISFPFWDGLNNLIIAYFNSVTLRDLIDQKGVDKSGTSQ